MDCYSSWIPLSLHNWDSWGGGGAPWLHVQNLSVQMCDSHWARMSPTQRFCMCPQCWNRPSCQSLAVNVVFPSLPTSGHILRLERRGALKPGSKSLVIENCSCSIPCSFPFPQYFISSSWHRLRWACIVPYTQWLMSFNFLWERFVMACRQVIYYLSSPPLPPHLVLTLALEHFCGPNWPFWDPDHLWISFTPGLNLPGFSGVSAYSYLGKWGENQSLFAVVFSEGVEQHLHVDIYNWETESTSSCMRAADDSAIKKKGDVYIIKHLMVHLVWQTLDGEREVKWPLKTSKLVINTEWMRWMWEGWQYSGTAVSLLYTKPEVLGITRSGS